MMKLEEIREIVAKHPFAEILSEDDIAMVSGCAVIAHYSPGQYLFKEGEPADHFYLVRAGRAALEIHAPGSGPQQILTFAADDVIGVSWLIPPYRWRFDARALDELSVLKFDAKCLRAKCDADPRLGYTLLQRMLPDLINRLHQSRLQLLDLYGGAPT